MKSARSLLLLAALAARRATAPAADLVRVTVTHSLSAPRPGEVIAVPWKDIVRLMPAARPEKLAVHDAAGSPLAYQFTNFHPETEGSYDEVLFQHDFPAGEQSAAFTIESLPLPALPFPARVFARYVPERYDDFAWENDRIAHRIYGPGLDTPAAGRSRMASSGIDVWVKRVRYPIVDRWYLRGHDNYHKDNGEGLDLYDVGTGRGCGGTGIWADGTLHVSRNWSSWRVLANGPLRAVFELTYAPWDAGHATMVSEVKRFTIDAGRNLDQIESTFTFSGPTTLTAAIGIGKHPKAKMSFTADANNAWMSEWEDYPTPEASGVGTGLVLGRGQTAASAEDDLNHLALVKVTSGQTVRYFTGAGWVRSGDFAGESDWRAYLAAFAARVDSPVSVGVH